jgi:hypothetical protein
MTSKDKFGIIAGERKCIYCGAEGEVVIHHEPPKGRSGKKGSAIKHEQDRRVVPLCVNCHEIRHRPSPDQTSLMKDIRDKCLTWAREIDIVMALCEILKERKPMKKAQYINNRYNLGMAVKSLSGELLSIMSIIELCDPNTEVFDGIREEINKLRVGIANLKTAAEVVK